MDGDWGPVSKSALPAVEEVVTSPEEERAQFRKKAGYTIGRNAHMSTDPCPTASRARAGGMGGGGERLWLW